jgi:hypothetical protein
MPSPPSRWPPLRSHRPLLIAAGLAALFVVGTASVLAAPPPQSVCGPCNDGLVAAGHAHSLPLRVAESTATVRVHPNGSATWTVTSTVAARDPDDDEFRPNASLRNVSELRTNETLRRAVVREAVDDSREYLEPDRQDASLQSLSMTDSTLRFSFREPDVARNVTGGALLFDEYHTRSLGSGWYVDVDRLTIVGPPNTTVGNDVRSAFGPSLDSVDGRRVVLEGDPENATGVAQDDLYVAFVPPGDAAGLRAAVGIAFATLPTVVDTFTSLHLPGLLVLLAALGGVHALRRRQERVSAGRRATLCWFALSLLGYLVVALVLVPPMYPYPMFGFFVTAFLVGVALVVAAVGWFLYPMVGRWIAAEGDGGEGRAAD